MKKLYSVFLLGLIFSCGSYAQISPGELSKAHEIFEGMSNCTKCHVMGEKVNNSKCLDCHIEIKKLIITGRGYHSSADVKNKDCWNCHSEHHGRNFRIVNFDKNKFDHSKTSFQLTGKHKKLKCEDCHQAGVIPGKDKKKKAGKYTGLNTNCNSCHDDYHQNTLGNNCSDCHNTESFAPATGFNHDKTAFKLTGAHKGVQCVLCHKIETTAGKKFQKFNGILFNSCKDCHKDIHLGKLGDNCSTCHSTASFQTINYNNFNHDKTDFPLIGKHNKVACKNCHKNGVAAKLKFNKCIDCHSDYHRGELSENNIPVDCSVCHTVEGFLPSLYRVEDHNKTRFPLTGSHLAVACGECHKKNKEWHFRISNYTCISCHDNIHGTEIAIKYMPGNDCTACHQVKAWDIVSFNHELTTFRLEGKHILLSCRNCHYRKNKNEENTLIFESLDSECETCHTDIHLGQFTGNEVSNCKACHTFYNWNPDLFDHNKTKFPLEGAHKNLNCSSCHKAVMTNSVSFIKYKMENFTCAACHS